MAITNIIGSHRLQFLRDACRKGSIANKAIVSALKASKGHLNVLVHPLVPIIHFSSLRKFLYALHLGYIPYFWNIVGTLKKAGPPVIVITNSSSIVPLWLIGLRSPRQFFLVASEADDDPTPVLSEYSKKASWRTFASRIKDLGVKSITLYGESSEDCVTVACTGLAPYFDAYFDGENVFPQEKPGLHWRLRCGVKRT